MWANKKAGREPGFFKSMIGSDQLAAASFFF